MGEVGDGVSDGIIFVPLDKTCEIVTHPLNGRVWWSCSGCTASGGLSSEEEAREAFARKHVAAVPLRP